MQEIDKDVKISIVQVERDRNDLVIDVNDLVMNATLRADLHNLRVKNNGEHRGDDVDTVPGDDGQRGKQAEDLGHEK